MTKYHSLFTSLAAPFAASEVKSRSQAGRQFSYVTARVIMNRLDEVVGPENWWDDYTPNGDSVICRLSVRLPDGTVITKSDAGGEAGMSDAGDNDKSGFSDAFKRAAVKFGVSRYLYRDGVATLSGPAAPPAAAAQIPAAPPPTPPAASPAKTTAKTPKTGPELHRYAVENTIDPNLANWIRNTFNPQGFPDRLSDFTPDEVRQALPSIREHLLTVKAARARIDAAG